VEAPYLRVANVQDGFLDLSEVKTIEVLPDDVDRYHLEDGDILMTEGHRSPGFCARAARLIPLIDETEKVEFRLVVNQRVFETSFFINASDVLDGSERSLYLPSAFTDSKEMARQ
jgi:hypothetical protein